MPSNQNPTPPAPTRIQLSAGQSYRLWSGRDGVVVVHSGSVQLREASYWIDHSMLDLRVNLQEGQHHMLERSGWASIKAERGAELLYYASPALGAVSLTMLARGVTAPLQWLRRRALQLLAPH